MKASGEDSTRISGNRWEDAPIGYPGATAAVAISNG